MLLLQGIEPSTYLEPTVHGKAGTFRCALAPHSLFHACVELSSKLIDAHTIALKRYKQVIHQIARLIANMVMVVVFARHDDFARLFGNLFEQLVFDVGKKTSRIALIGAGIATGVNS